MSFVTVKFDRNQSMLFNPNCKTLVLLDDIKKRCNCKNDAILEVSDTKGEIKHLQDHLEDYATSLLKGREILILLEIKSNEETNEIKYEPLLRNLRKLYPDAYERLSRMKSNNSENKDGLQDNLKSSLRLHKTRHATHSAHGGHGHGHGHGGHNTSNSHNHNNNNNITLQVIKGNRKPNDEHKRRGRTTSFRSEK